MATTIIALFDNPSEAERVLQDMTREGFKRDEITLLGAERGTEGEAGESFTQEARARAVAGGIEGALEKLGLSGTEARSFAERVQGNGSIVALTLEESQFNRAMDLIKQHKASDIRQLEFQARAGGLEAERSTLGREGAERLTTVQEGMQGRHEESVRIPVIEEELHVGKREVEHGGVRITTHVEEMPVDEAVRLHEEHITVERHPVDRPVTATGTEAFKEGMIEMREMAEEVVIGKQAREVEEVVVSKDVEEHVERIHDTVRRTEVDVEQLGQRQPAAGRIETRTEPTAELRTEAGTGARTFALGTTPSAYRDTFLKDYDTRYSTSGLGFDYYEPAYSYGVILAGDKRYLSREWGSVEPDAFRAWEERNPGTWDQYKNAIRYGWDQARGRK